MAFLAWLFRTSGPPVNMCPPQSVVGTYSWGWFLSRDSLPHPSHAQFENWVSEVWHAISDDELRSAGFCLVSVLPYPGGGWVGGSGRILGWVGVQPPPPPRVGWDFVGVLGSIEPVPLLSFFCCRFRVTCLFTVCLHVIAYHVCMPHAHKGARILCGLCWMRRG